ncbi:MAG: hypothetical protein IPL86_12490 [Flavobacteriales bacterium]|nr:hypothetical protein [Flavobacteriales bacterium]MBP9160468.1 hypothetical protein [Flavobacteriales bacterium]
MKKKVTLSLKPQTVAMLRKAGARRAKPMSAIVDELMEELEKKEKAKEDDFAWLEEMGTWLSGKFTKKDFEDDPRLAYSFGYKPKDKKKKAKAK